MTTRAWDAANYDGAWDRMRARGVDLHGEVDFLERLFAREVFVASDPILDAGCGTGRVAIELARRGHEVVGTDVDTGMLAEAARKAPEIEWHLGNLADIDLGRSFAAVAMAGNVILFVEPADRPAVIANMSTLLRDGAVLVAGFQLSRSGGRRVTVDEWDRWTSANGLVLIERFATWAEDEWTNEADYAVSVHRKESCHH